MNIKKIAKSTAIIGGGLIVIGGIGVGITGYWPIALVERTPVTYNTFRENFVMADHFYRSNLKINGEDDRIVMAKDVQRDLQRVTMEGLVEGILIDHELSKRYAASDLQQLVNNKLNGVDLSSADMGRATELLYGLTPDQFRELVLIPKAKQEILEGNLMLQDGNLNDWIGTRKNEASVSVFIPTLYWNKNSVEIK
jgi:hypothetical protein